jgi:hypothetical protein
MRRENWKTFSGELDVDSETLADEEPRITYSIRDLFERLDTKLTDIKESLDMKADKARVVELEVRVAQLEAARHRIVGAVIGLSAVAGVVGNRLAEVFLAGNTG